MQIMMLAVLAILPVATSTPQQLEHGRYDAVPRDSTVHNRFLGVEFDFQADGRLVWRRGARVEQVMLWRSTDEVFEIEESVGCRMSPRGVYRIAPWLEGFALQVMQDGCTYRVA